MSKRKETVRTFHGEGNNGKRSAKNTMLYSIWHHLLEKDGKRCEEFCSYLQFKEWALNNGFDEENGRVKLCKRDNEEIHGPNNSFFSTIPPSHVIMLTHGGMTMCLTDWAHYLGMSKQALWSRIFIHEWSVEKALTTQRKD